VLWARKWGETTDETQSRPSVKEQGVESRRSQAFSQQCGDSVGSDSSLGGR